jgi:tRNA (Thr-GGU) A37 N-methylase
MGNSCGSPHLWTGRCKVLSIRNEIITVDKIDALDGSPILDIKPYIPSIDCETKGVRVPDWLKG